MLLGQRFQALGGCDLPGKGPGVIFHKFIECGFADLLTKSIKEQPAAAVDDGTVLHI